MTPSDYVKRFAKLCKQQQQSIKLAWEQLTTEDHQALISGLQEEWDSLTLCLSLWKRPHMDWKQANDIDRPEINCTTCTQFTELSRWCGQYEKAIPNNYDTAKACKEWSL